MKAQISSSNHSRGIAEQIDNLQTERHLSSSVVPLGQRVAQIDLPACWLLMAGEQIIDGMVQNALLALHAATAVPAVNVIALPSLHLGKPMLTLTPSFPNVSDAAALRPLHQAGVIRQSSGHNQPSLARPKPARQS
jgi:hypothetical protein